MTAALPQRPTGYRLSPGEWFNTLTDFINKQFTAKSIQTVAAAGATQGNATAINANLGHVIKVTVTASTEGVKLPTASTGDRWTILADPLVGVKVYPASNGIIGSAATNAAVALVKNKGNIYIGVDTRRWRVIVGG